MGLNFLIFLRNNTARFAVLTVRAVASPAGGHSSGRRFAPSFLFSGFSGGPSQSPLHSPAIRVRFRVAAIHVQRVLPFSTAWSPVFHGLSVGPRSRRTAGASEGIAFRIPRVAGRAADRRVPSDRRRESAVVGHLQGWRRSNHETSVRRRRDGPGSRRMRPFSLGSSEGTTVRESGQSGRDATGPLDLRHHQPGDGQPRDGAERPRQPQ